MPAEVIEGRAGPFRALQKDGIERNIINKGSPNRSNKTIFTSHGSQLFIVAARKELGSLDRVFHCVVLVSEWDVRC